MSPVANARTMRADDFTLSEETKRLRDEEQARITEGAYAEAMRLLERHRPTLDRVAHALIERETLGRDELLALFADVPAESRSAESVGVPRVVALRADA